MAFGQAAVTVLLIVPNRLDLLPDVQNRLHLQVQFFKETIH
jgi:hypothetical protein